MNGIQLTWSQIKNFVATRDALLQFVEIETNYFLIAFDGMFEVTCVLSKDGQSDVVDFEYNYKNLSNKKINVRSPFADKILPHGKKLYYRLHGISTTITSSPQNIDFSIPYPSCKITGMAVINGAIGDTVNVKVLDTPTGIISGIPNFVLNQFGFDMNLAKDFHKFTSPYDADLLKDMQIRIEFSTTNIVPKIIYVNFHLHEVK